MVTLVLDKKFVSVFSKIHDQQVKNRITNQLGKIKSNPRIGKPMRYGWKGTRELYVKPYRLSYAIREDKIDILA